MQLNKIYKGDCIEVMKTFTDQSVDVIHSDPPYGISGSDLEWKEKSYVKVNELWDTFTEDEYVKFTRDWLVQAHRVLAPNGSIFICCSYHNLAEIQLTVKQLGFKLLHLITWFKTNSMPNKNRRSLTYSSEFIIWAVKGPGWIFNYEESKRINPAKGMEGKDIQMRDVWLMPFCAGHERLKDSEGKSIHSTQKPEQLIERCLRISTNFSDDSKPKSLVLDPFIGSGTVAKVCQNLGLPWVGIEMEQKYIDAALIRLGQKPEVVQPTSEICEQPKPTSSSDQNLVS